MGCPSGKLGVNKALYDPQDELEYMFNHQSSCGGKVRIAQRSPL
ncbi:uncharacterized 12.7 kDa protein in transposon Tn903 [Edwardsiella piscicida]|uniref:Uncharacterized 12.7 kDa protein in transposon Tn903 n=1 Tax=Edwardsiella piscicida TaxID=1263550 RepID=A0AAU8PK09_EDWPI|nr:uncharacterized 12.7 kDa protein in transposon Tn903 [Edwardsiella tarda EIB202]